MRRPCTGRSSGHTDALALGSRWPPSDNIRRMPDPAVHVLTSLSPADYESICQLLPQMSSSPLPTLERLSHVVESTSNRVLVARIDGRIVGMLTVVIVDIPTKRAAHIDDVVVDEHARGQGIGRTLARTAIEEARRAGARHVDLTSRPEREAANHLYQSLGFTQRLTGMHRLDLTQ
jgi:ribosomal protein S18 acetylase RimI-like enzyme